jgi:type VI protein secretion system component Hcp
VDGCSGFIATSVSHIFLPARGSVTLTKDVDKCAPSLLDLAVNNIDLAVIDDILMQDSSGGPVMVITLTHVVLTSILRSASAETLQLSYDKTLL